MLVQHLPPLINKIISYDTVLKNNYKVQRNNPMDSNIPITIMSVSAAFGRKRTPSQHVLENADPLVVKKKHELYVFHVPISRSNLEN